MSNWEFQRSVTSMRLTAEMAVDAGLSMRDCLAGTGVSELELSDAEFTVSGKQELRLIRNVLSALDEQYALGIRAGSRYHFTAYGALGFAIVSSRSARSALDVALRHFHLTFSFVPFIVSDHAEETRVLVEDNEVPEDVATFVVDRAVAALITIGRDLYGPTPILRRLELRVTRPTDPSSYDKFFGAAIRFGARRNLVVFDRKLMERPLIQANEPARLVAIEQCCRLLEARKARGGFSSKVRSKLVTASAQMPTMEVIAKDLCMTPRTLHRRLRDEGTGFADLRDEVRQALAEELLLRQRLSIEQIAERLGYAETSGFIHAYKRWYGTTPHAFRLASPG